MLGAGQFFVCAFLATDPPPRRLIWAQLAAWNVGTMLVAVGVPTATSGLVDGGGALIAAGLVLFAAALRGMQRRSLQRAPWALRWYQASAVCLGVGALAGVLMARDTPWPYGSLLGAHLALNLGGWFGTAIIGTLHTFFPSLTGRSCAIRACSVPPTSCGCSASSDWRPAQPSTATPCSPSAGPACFSPPRCSR